MTRLLAPSVKNPLIPNNINGGLSIIHTTKNSHSNTAVAGWQGIRDFNLTCITLLVVEMHVPVPAVVHYLLA
jgi:hypothetical protein